MDNKKRYRITVSGRVQGVGFRYFTRDAAQTLGLSGWVMNLIGGDVELEAEGEQSAIDKLIEELKQGPPLSRVTDVDVQELVAMGSNEEFFIHRRITRPAAAAGHGDGRAGVGGDGE
jgi:acylphosphatase